MFAELNGVGIDWGVDSREFPYKKIPELDQSGKYVVKGMFINKNKTEKELKEYGCTYFGWCSSFNS